MQDEKYIHEFSRDLLSTDGGTTWEDGGGSQLLGLNTSRPVEKQTLRMVDG
jgi:hypothetical protein